MGEARLLVVAVAAWLALVFVVVVVAGRQSPLDEAELASRSCVIMARSGEAAHSSSKWRAQSADQAESPMRGPRLPSPSSQR